LAQGEWNSTAQFIGRALSILKQERPMTIRQLFYRLVSVSEISNSLRDYQRVSRIMTKVREDGRCPFEWIVDRSRPTYQPNVWTNPQAYAEVVKNSYRKDYWAMQPVHVEVWTEKDAIIGSIAEITDELGVTVRVGRGFQSTTMVRQIATLFAKISKPKIVFYLGDHDPSGHDIERDLRHRVQSHVPSGKTFDLRRLAIFEADIQKFNLPPLRVKQSDSRAISFLAKFSNRCVELDALPPTELRHRLRSAIEKVMDIEAWNRAVQVEQVEIASILETVSRWPTTAR